MSANMSQGMRYDPLRMDVHSSRMRDFQGAKSIVLVVRHSFDSGPGRRVAVLTNLRKDSGDGPVMEVPWGLLESESNRTLRKGGLVEVSDGKEKALFLVTNVIDVGLKSKSPLSEPVMRSAGADKGTN
ncbi:MAG: hypothetical protein AB1295_02035 [Candidatus Micrarchaeota archaeon]